MAVNVLLVLLSTHETVFNKKAKTLLLHEIILHGHVWLIIKIRRLPWVLDCGCKLRLYPLIDILKLVINCLSSACFIIVLKIVLVYLWKHISVNNAVINNITLYFIRLSIYIITLQLEKQLLFLRLFRKQFLLFSRHNCTVHF